MCGLLFTSSVENVKTHIEGFASKGEGAPPSKGKTTEWREKGGGGDCDCESQKVP